MGDSGGVCGGVARVRVGLHQSVACSPGCSGDLDKRCADRSCSHTVEGHSRISRGPKKITAHSTAAAINMWKESSTGEAPPFS